MRIYKIWALLQDADVESYLDDFAELPSANPL